MKRLSVIITSYNYERFVGTAIESALALAWGDVEVVVVDDGSTDGSLEIINRYADEVTILATENASQRVAASRGFAASTGDVVIFLDADDVLPPELGRHLAGAMTPSVSKVQFQMQLIDAAGAPLAKPFPTYEPLPSPQDIRRWVSKTSAYPTPPGSGNAYARWFLDKIFPLDASIGNAADSGCLAAAPHLGDVVSVPGVVVGYRWHGTNQSDPLRSDKRFRFEIEKARGRWRYAQRALGVTEEKIDDEPLFRSRELLKFRVAAYRVAPSLTPVLPGDGFGRLLVDIARSPWHTGPEPLWQRLVVASWLAATLLAPKPLVRPLIVRRFRRRIRSSALSVQKTGVNAS